MKNNRTESFGLQVSEHKKGREEGRCLSPLGGDIAITGLAFRFPGDLGNLQALWAALQGATDLVTKVPGERWAVDLLQHPRRSEPGRSVTFSAGVLSKIEEFDASFFGISPREAGLLDPQQRLLLELAWEAMEDAGVPPASLAGSDCAVFVGISGLDYGIRTLDDLSSMGAHSMTGSTLSIAANRLSYVFDLHGPSMAVDTACSSSLVALNQACQCLASGQSSTALVGGVNLLLHPYPFVGFTKASMLSAEGRCRPFAEGGSGYVRAEGGAVLLLKPLSRAEADGDLIYGVIRGSGVNADGCRKSGLTIPSAEAQIELMQKVLQQAGVAPEEVDYVEAHGTGTKVGDPVEAAALGHVFGRFRPEGAPLPIGSIKGNLGHMEPASGMAGLVKALLVLRQGVVPPSIHADTLNAGIDFGRLNLDLVRKPLVLPAQNNRPLRVGVNSFGFGGANAHVLLEAYRAPPAELSHGHSHPAGSCSASPASGNFLSGPPLVLSARSREALQALALRYAELLEAGEATPYDVAWAAWHQREWLEERLAVPVIARPEAAAELRLFASGVTAIAPAVQDRPLAGGPVRLAFVYSGNGAQWVGMGRTLLRESSWFAEVMARLDEQIFQEAGFSVLDALRQDEPEAMADTAIAQPALFAIQVALTQMLRARGLEVEAAAGHSVGEIAAAWAMGCLSLEQAVRVIVARSRAQATTRGTGRMAAVGLGAVAMQNLLERHGLTASIEVAGVNSPRNVTVSGTLESLQNLQSLLKEEGAFYRLLDLDYAFHSQAMEPIQQALLADLEGLAPVTGSGRFFSTVTGTELDGAGLGAAYWWRNVRDPVLFDAAVRQMAEAGYRVFVEISPHVILQRYLSESLQAQGEETRVLGTLRKNDDGEIRVQETVLRSLLLGAPVSPGIFFPHPPAVRVKLPAYPWQRQRFWYDPGPEAYGLILRQRVHPLLGYRLKEFEAAWENHLDVAVLPWLQDHRVGGAVILPGAAYVEMALAASREFFGTEAFVLEELDILAPVVLEEEAARTLRLVFSPGDYRFRIEGRRRLVEEPWTIHAVGRLLGAPALVCSRGQDTRAGVQSAGVEQIDRQSHYAQAHALGLQYGPVFQGIASIEVQETRLLAHLAWQEGLEEEGYLLHPAVLDQCFQAVLGWFHHAAAQQPEFTFLPVKVGRLNFWGGRACWLEGRLVRHSHRSLLVDFDVLDAQGNRVAEALGCRFRAARVQAGSRMPALWSVVPRLASRSVLGQSRGFPENRKVLEHIRHRFADPALGTYRQGRKHYFSDIVPLLETLPMAFGRDALLALGQGGDTSGRIGPEVLIQYQSRHPLAAWLIDTLKNQGYLTADQENWRLADETELPAAELIWRAVLGDCPAAMPELLLMGQVGARLDRLFLAGKLEGYQPSSELMDQLFSQSPAYEAMGQALVLALEKLLAHWPRHRRLRILQLAGEASGLPHIILRSLGGMQTQLDYVLAEPSKDVQARLALEYANLPVTVVSMDPETFELSDTPARSSIFDIVIVPGLLHRMSQPARCLTALEQCLGTGGVLLLTERYPDAAANLIFGVDPVWWHEAALTGATSEAGATDPAEPPPLFRASLLAPQDWISLLGGMGWENPFVFEEPDAQGVSAGSYLLVANRKERVQRIELPPPVRWSFQLFNLESPEKVGVPGWLDSAVGRLMSAGQQVSLVGEEAIAKEPGDHLVFVLPPSQPDKALEAKRLSRCCEQVRLLVLLAAQQQTPPRVWIVTQGGALADPGFLERAADPAAAAVWGLGRVVMNEYPQLSLTLLDVPMDAADTDLTDLLEQEFLCPDGEQEIILGRAGRYVIRIEPAVLPEAEKAEESGELNVPAWHLDFTLAGQLRNLNWYAANRRELRDDEVEIEACAAGLNFRDVMYAMGLLSDEALENGFAGASLGLEVAGRVSRCGPGVVRFAAGDEVLAFAGASFASHVIVPERAIARKPETWSFADAATVPTVFFTVWYALKHLANLQPGERILIHGGAGGVGIAAIQLARYLGAEVFVTAGSPEKRDFVTLLGVDHVFDSRSLAFADEILAITGGEGVDVVLNSLAGEAINRNLHVLRPFGRFLELGKRDFYENTPIGLRPFKDNLSYFGIDADQLMKLRPDYAAHLFREVMALFEAGILRPLPHRIFSADHVVEAFRHMQQAKQIGKVVIDLQQPPSHIQHVQAFPGLSLRPDASYLVTGGLSGFGLATAHWLVDKGARHLVLLGRRGMDTPGFGAEFARLKARGAEVSVHACDVSQYGALERVFAEMRNTLPPLRGVIHAAMVLEDGLLANLDREKFEKVLAPKLEGAWHLHGLSRDIPLDFFVLYSSATTFVGNPGQANYVAANAGLEALARLRRQSGLPAIAVAWGAIADTGVLTRNETAREGLQARLGTSALPVAQALMLLEQFLTTSASMPGQERAVLDMDWGSLERLLPSAQTRRFEWLRQHMGHGHGAESDTDVRALLAGCGQEEGLRIVCDILGQEVADILRIPLDRLDMNCSLYDVGMDSLMAVELALSVEKRFGISLPPMVISENPSIARISARLLAQLTGGQDTEAVDATTVMVERVVAQHAVQAEGLAVEELAADVRLKAEQGARLIS